MFDGVLEAHSTTVKKRYSGRHAADSIHCALIPVNCVIIKDRISFLECCLQGDGPKQMILHVMQQIIYRGLAET